MVSPLLKKVMMISKRKHRRKQLVTFLNQRMAVKEILLKSAFESNKFISKKIIIFEIIINIIRLASQLRNDFDLFIATDMTNSIPTLIINKLLQKKVVLTNFYLHSIADKFVIKAILKFLLDKQVYVIVQSMYEFNFYSTLCPKATIKYIPYHQDFTPVERGRVEKEYVFAGGYTNRDYSTLLKAGQNTQFNYRIICSRLNNLSKYPSNFEVYYDTDTDFFHSSMNNAKIVVINLKSLVGSSGQMTVLNAMSMGKPIVYSNNDTINHYLEDGVTGLKYRAQDVKDLKKKITILMSDSRLRNKLSINARRKYVCNYAKEKEWKKIARFVCSISCM